MVQWTSPPRCWQENHHYSLRLNYGNRKNDAALDNKYQYNGKEINDDFGLNWYEYGARGLDRATGRWWSVDPMAEPTASHSTYHYAYNNPVSYIDMFGMWPKAAAAEKEMNPGEKLMWIQTYGSLGGGSGDCCDPFMTAIRNAAVGILLRWDMMVKVGMSDSRDGLFRDNPVINDVTTPLSSEGREFYYDLQTAAGFAGVLAPIYEATYYGASTVTTFTGLGSAATVSVPSRLD
ncbi:MAG: hypothetical protein IPN76_07490 [Saprospiraceae bacterium]|nr:hypothetical protein [Saprospiraceae bacterium]